jgi:hypothetical protein
MENKELRPFTHRIYTDFSGDDGDTNTPGASKCLCGAWILSAEEDIRFNEKATVRAGFFLPAYACRLNSDNPRVSSCPIFWLLHFVYSTLIVCLSRLSRMARMTMMLTKEKLQEIKTALARFMSRI